MVGRDSMPTQQPMDKRKHFSAKQNFVAPRVQRIIYLILCHLICLERTLQEDVIVQALLDPQDFHQVSPGKSSVPPSMRS